MNIISKPKELAEDMFSLAKATEAAASASDSAARKFGKAANAVDGAGKKWTMFSRILSGSALWKLQNYIRSVGQAMDMYYDKSEKMVEAANKQAKGFSELINQSSTLKEQLELLKEADHEKLIETNVEYQNMFIALEKIKGAEEAKSLALERTRKMYKEVAEQTDKVIKSEGKLLVATMEREKEMAKITAGRKEIKENRKEWEEQAEWIKKNKKVLAEYSEIQQSIGLPPGSPWTAESLASGDERRKGKLLGKVGKSEEEMDELLKFQKEEFTATKRQMRFLINWAQDVNMLWKSMKKISTKTFKAGVEKAKVYLSAAKKGIMIFGKLLFTFTLIALVVFILRNLWKFAKEKWPDGTGEFMNNVKFVLFGLWKTIVYVAEGLYYFGMIFVNWVQLVMALFSGESDKVKEAFSNISKNIGNLAISLLSGLGSLLVTGIGLVMTWMVGWFSTDAVPQVIEGFSAIIGGLPELIKGVMSSLFDEKTSGWTKIITGAITVALLRAFALALVPLVGPIVGPILAIAVGVDAIARLITGKGIWAWAKDKLGGGGAEVEGVQGTNMSAIAATGANFITSGPTSLLVGDNAGGKELVQVTPLSSPNINGPRGGNVINVHVNGRVGASDSELNDIAKKVGKLISREISRSTSTNTRF